MRMDEPQYFKIQEPLNPGRDKQGRLLSPSEILFGESSPAAKNVACVRLSNLNQDQKENAVNLGLDLSLYEKFVHLFEGKTLIEQKLIAEGCVYSNGLIERILRRSASVHVSI